MQQKYNAHNQINKKMPLFMLEFLFNQFEGSIKNYYTATSFEWVVLAMGMGMAWHKKLQIILRFALKDRSFYVYNFDAIFKDIIIKIIMVYANHLFQIE